MTIEEKLRLLREGSLSLLTEAPKDDDTITDDKDTDLDDDKGATLNADNTDPADDSSKDDSIDTDPPADDDSDDDSGDDDSGDGETGDTPTDDLSDDNSPSNPNEFIQLDDNSRKLLDYKNFQKYRELRDDIEYLVNELNELTLVNDEARKYTNTVISKATDLITKLSDYIIHKYKLNSYEINYKNFMDFVLEKRLVYQAKEEIVKLNTVK